MKHNFMLLLLSFFSILISCSKNDDTNTNNANTNCEDVDFSMSTSKWKMYSVYDSYKSPAAGVYEQSSGGLKAYNLTYRGGSMILTNKEFDLTGRTIYYKWKVDGEGGFSGTCPFISNDCYDDPFETSKQLGFLSTDFSWSEYVKINDNAEYYTRLQIGASDVKSITSANNYDDQGGTVIQNITINNVNPIGRFGIYIGDAYTVGASLTLIECKIR